jgi:cation diffusion facilitator CzcD-associated flavoprotein CzcO
LTDLDVLIIGAGISGIGVAHYLQKRRPGTRYVILEGRGEIGGTWSFFRFPGIRSDSDLFTFGYDFKPWHRAQAFADGASIQAYVADAARENGIERHIRFHHKVLEAGWSSAERRWSVRAQRTDTSEEVVLRARWLFSAAGYYRYDEGYTPEFAGRERFRGRIVHPQNWPQDLDCRGKRIVVIGSGATAVTLVPALAAEAAHVTMLQRTPSYVLPLPAEDVLAKRLRPVLGDRLTHAIARRVNMTRQRLVYAFCRNYPHAARRWIAKINARFLPEGYPVDVHFNPPYGPWEQRLCVAAGGDLFKAIREGKASVVTERIDTFTESGIRLQSGAQLDADVIVTATGFNLQAFGGVKLRVDERPVRPADTVTFKGMMMSGVPNFANAMGYAASSWTLRIGLLGEYFSRLLRYMDGKGYEVCTPVAQPGMATRPFLGFSPGYVQRSAAEMPRQGEAFPWLTSMTYAADVKLLRRGPVHDRHLRFT